jgi:tetraacyldisaccharide 4'-kinase
MNHRLADRPPPPRFPFLVSVGNLRVGGTGKTPVVLDLARHLVRRGYRGAILTRGYGSANGGPLVVHPTDPDAADEARLLATSVAEWSVVQARNRAAGLRFILDTASTPPDMVLLDDGHQTARVPRHLDVLILDRWQRRGMEVSPETGLVLPWGPYRETSLSAERATIWLVETAEKLPDSLHGIGVTGEIPVVPFTRRLSLSPALETTAWEAYGVVSGLARPERFERDCAGLLGREPCLVVRYEDHCAYNRRQVQELAEAGRKVGAVAWLTSAKDWVKLSRFWPAALPVAVPDLAITWPAKETLPDLVEERFKENRG